MTVTITFDAASRSSWSEANKILQRLRPIEETTESVTEGDETTSVEEVLGEEVYRYVHERTPKSIRHQVIAWLLHQAAMGRTLRIGVSKKSADGYGPYIQVLVGHQYGAVAVVTPASGRIDFRLPPRAAEGYEFATGHPSRTSAYKVQAYLTRETYEECVGLSNDAEGYGNQSADWV